MMTRREFVSRTLKVAFIGAAGAVTVSACAAEHTVLPTQPFAVGSICSGSPKTIYANPGHRHVAVNLTPEQLEAAVPGQYELLGGGTHSHFFDLSAEDFASLVSGQVVQKTDIEGDGHIIEISC